MSVSRAFANVLTDDLAATRDFRRAEDFMASLVRDGDTYRQGR